MAGLILDANVNELLSREMTGNNERLEERSPRGRTTLWAVIRRQLTAKKLDVQL